MEVGGLATSMASLGSLASTVVEGLKYVQFARSFGSDYNIALLKVDLLRLRLSRWSEVVGAAKANGLVIPPDEVKLSNRTLCKIHDYFESVRMYSTESSRTAEDKNTTLGPGTLHVYDDSNLEGDFKTMHIALSNITKRRHKETSLMKKTKWALFDRERFDGMIDNLGFFITTLEKTIPSSAPMFQQIVHTEVEEIARQDNIEHDGLKLLQQANAQEDGLFERAMTEAMTKTYGHTYLDTTVLSSSEIQQGNIFVSGFTMGNIPISMLGSHKFEGTKIEDNVKAHQGDFYGYEIRHEH